MNTHDPISAFLGHLAQSLETGSFVKLSLGHYKGGDAQLVRLHARRILVKKEEKLSFTYQYKTRDIVKNYPFSEGLTMLRELLTDEFHAATLLTTASDWHLQKNGGKISIRKAAPAQTETADASHDRQKKRLIAPGGKAYLHALDITDTQGNVLKNAQDKYRQINKYVEILSGLVKNIAPGKLTKIADMGCGKGYLTFALYDYLSNTLNMRPEVIGVDTRPDMVALCNKIAKESGFDGLRFVEDTIEHYDSAGVNLLIALHACDTATDEAIFKGITADAELIVVAPCCHKQIRRQMDAQQVENAVSFLTKHGIFAERQAEMVTDGMRALILEYFGYGTKVFEFISDAHTPKNVMIVGTKQKTARDPRLLEKLKETKAYFGIGYHHLERMLKLAPSA